MSFAVYLTVSEVKAFRYLFNDRAAAVVWFEKQLIAASKKKVVADFSGEIVQTYDLTTVVPMQEYTCEHCGFKARTGAGLASHERGCRRTEEDMARQEKLSRKVDEDLARLQAEDNAAGVGEDVDVSPFANAQPSGATKEEILARGDDPKNVEATFGPLESSPVPPCPQAETALPGELTKAIQERPVAAVEECPFCEEEGALYDFVDVETGDVNRACVGCWIEVSK